MFGGDQDLSFVDDDFLQDVFQSPASKNTNIKEKEHKLVSKTPPSQSLPNVVTSNLKFSSDAGKSGSNDTNCKKKINEKHSPDDFDFDDNFPYEGLELIECENQPLNVVRTPPDSEFTQCSISQGNNDFTVSRTDRAITTNNLVKPMDFRSKILQTLNKNKNVALPAEVVTNNNAHSSDSFTYSKCSEKRTLDESEVVNDVNSPLIKRPHTQSRHREAVNNYDSPVIQPLRTQGLHREEGNPSHTISPTSHVRTGNHRTPHITERIQPLSRDHEDVPRQRGAYHQRRLDPFRVPEDPAQPEGQTWTSTTPVKANIPQVRKTVSPGGPVVRKRKFPGPAGLLPQPGSSINKSAALEPEDDSPSKASRAPEPIVCSQSTAHDFTRGPWQHMLNDLELDPDDPTSPVRVFTVKWVVRRAGLRGQAGVRKVPFLAVLVHNIDVTSTDATLVLRDPSGEINGTMSSSVMDELGDILQPGSVLVLKGVTILSPIGLHSVMGSREHTRRHYLNITLNTVLTIYTPDDEGHIITTAVGQVDKNELHRQAASPSAVTGPRVIVEEEEEEEEGIREHSAHNNSLFSNMNDSFSGSSNDSFTFSPRVPAHRSPRFAPTSGQQGNFNRMPRFGQQQQQNRAQFNSQQGTRPQFNSQQGTRPQFNSQQGTRPQFNSQQGTRPQFNSQQGTRPQFNSPQQINRARFNSQLQGNRPQFNSLQQTNRALFNSQQGNRSQLNSPQQSNRPQFNSHVSLRPQQPVPPRIPTIRAPLPPMAGSQPSPYPRPPQSINKGIDASPEIPYSNPSEEKEVTDLLSGLDTDSLFGDF